MYKQTNQSYMPCRHTGCFIQNDSMEYLVKMHIKILRQKQHLISVI